MPILDITAADIAKPTYEKIAYVGAIMLWPHAPKRREIAMRTDQLTAAIIPDIGEHPERYIALGPAGWQALLRHALDAMPPGELGKAKKTPTRNGIIAGEKLIAVVEQHLEAERKKLKTVKLSSIDEDIINRGKRVGSLLKFSLKTLENTIWKNYRPVSHLWGAYLWPRLVDPLPGATFPAEPAAFGDFLALGAWLGRMGSGIRVRQHGPLFSAGEQWMIPAELGLPDCEFDGANHDFLRRQGEKRRLERAGKVIF